MSHTLWSTGLYSGNAQGRMLSSLAILGTRTQATFFSWINARLPGMLLAANNRKYDEKKFIRHLRLSHGTKSPQLVGWLHYAVRALGFLIFPFCHYLCVGFRPHVYCLMTARQFLCLKMQHLISGRKKKGGGEAAPYFPDINLCLMTRNVSQGIPRFMGIGQSKFLCGTYCYPNKTEFSLLRRVGEWLLGRQLATSATLV